MEELVFNWVIVTEIKAKKMGTDAGRFVHMVAIN